MEIEGGGGGGEKKKEKKKGRELKGGLGKTGKGGVGEECEIPGGPDP